MADPRFFAVAGPFSLKRLIEVSGATVAPGTDIERLFSDVAPLATAGPQQVSFLRSEERRGGQECVNACIYTWWPDD